MTLNKDFDKTTKLTNPLKNNRDDKLEFSIYIDRTNRYRNNIKYYRNGRTEYRSVRIINLKYLLPIIRRFIIRFF